MIVGQFEEDYYKAIRERITEIKEFIAGGKCTSFDEYKGKCKQIQGLQEALDIFKSVAKAYGELEDD